MNLELIEGDRTRPDATVMVTTGVALVRAHGAVGTAVGGRLSANDRAELQVLAAAAAAVLLSVDDPQALVVPRPAAQHGSVNTLIVGSGKARREISWAYPDRVPPEVEKLFRTLQMLQWEVPRAMFKRRLPGLCAEAAEVETGVPAAQWRVVERTDETFNVRYSLPNDAFAGAMVMAAIPGERVTLRSGNRFVAFHCGQAGVVKFAEEWLAGELPRYQEACIDIAHRERAAGHWHKALDALQGAGNARRWDRAQPQLERAEILAEHGEYREARRIFNDYVGCGSQEAHVLASCGLAWVKLLESLPVAAPKPPAPSRWAELGLAGWWRLDAARVVEGVPAAHPTLGAALMEAPTTWWTAMDSRGAHRGEVDTR